ncbi:hypothetical protein G3N95_01235 [Paraburkholderia sp. Tr-20389]|uniref:anti-sigma factor family protein n=1 Tax=Paraburkholderia sp. Tr-20389 TaxID=2703903 RepID=UPI00197EF915|nr:hypothetical protein [Paraburkholderia sp. Tr-20389]MBN3751549.1 hypothetical protein [Paraburkholderia sp. Tr-20389]
MDPDDIELMAYVDGTLPAHQHRAVRRAASASPEIARRVAALEASRLPYAAAFAQQTVPPVPASLRATIDELLRTARLNASPTRKHPPLV